MNSFNPELQLKDTEFAISKKLIGLLTEWEGFNFAARLVLQFHNIKNDDKIKYNTFYSNSKADTIFNESYIGDVFESIYSTIIVNI